VVAAHDFLRFARTAPVQYGTDTIFLPGYGQFEGVVLPAAHPYSLGRLGQLWV
jgi:hypothetical protein